jgi:hypothetical protein
MGGKMYKVHFVARKGEGMVYIHPVTKKAREFLKPYIDADPDTWDEGELFAPRKEGLEILNAASFNLGGGVYMERKAPKGYVPADF